MDTDKLLDAAWRSRSYTLPAGTTATISGSTVRLARVRFAPSSEAVVSIGPSVIRYSPDTQTAHITPSVPLIDWILREWTVVDPVELLTRVRAEQALARLTPPPFPRSTPDPDEDDFPEPPRATWYPRP